jgi:hypothetical protein
LGHVQARCRLNLATGGRLLARHGQDKADFEGVVLGHGAAGHEGQNRKRGGGKKQSFFHGESPEINEHNVVAKPNMRKYKYAPPDISVCSSSRAAFRELPGF